MTDPLEERVGQAIYNSGDGELIWWEGFLSPERARAASEGMARAAIAAIGEAGNDGIVRMFAKAAAIREAEPTTKDVIDGLLDVIARASRIAAQERAAMTLGVLREAEVMHTSEPPRDVQILAGFLKDIRGACTDELPYPVIDQMAARALDVAEPLTPGHEPEQAKTGPKANSPEQFRQCDSCGAMRLVGKPERMGDQR